MADRIVDLNSGLAMVVTDLHGVWSVYQRLRDKFLLMRAMGQIDRLVICGDLIHADRPGEDDDSLDMLLDVMRLQRELGPDVVVMLMGNHELPHVYSVPLSRGDISYTPVFEAELAELDREKGVMFRREDVINFLAGLPLYARTKAGVLLTHAGASPKITTPDAIHDLIHIDHLGMLAAVDAQLRNVGYDEARASYERIARISYDKQARQLMAVTGANDPRYYHLLRGVYVSTNNPAFDLLWSALFTYNEMEIGLANYETVTKTFLESLSKISPHEQRVLVAGHIGIENGYGFVGPQHLRLASYAHARPRHTGRYLLLDCETPVRTVAQLVPRLHRVMES